MPIKGMILTRDFLTIVGCLIAAAIIILYLWWEGIHGR